MKVRNVGVWGVVLLWATVVQAFTYRVEMSRPDGVYAAGDRVPLVVTTVETNGEKVASGTVRYSLDNFGKRKFSDGSVNLAKENPFTVVATRETPGVVRLTLKAKDAKDFVWGVAFSPEKIRTGSVRPADFDAFWADAKARYDREVPVDVKLEKLDRFSNEMQTVYRLSLTTPHGKTIDGVLTEPADLSKGPYPVRLSVPGAGPSTGCPTEANGMIRLTMNVHYYPMVVGEHKHSKGNAELLKREKAETAECKAKYRVNRYAYAGVAVSREEYHYYDCILAISRAFDWLWARPEVKKDDFRYSGTSQGGGFGLIMTGFNTHITRTVAYVPAMTDTLGYLDDGRQSGWPQLVEGHPEDLKAAAAKNAPYFDAAHFAARIKTPIRVAVELSDTVCAPAAVWAGYNAIPSADKAILPTPGMGHKVGSKVYRTLGAWLDSSTEFSADLIVYGSTPAAISAAVQAKRMGKTAIVVSPETRIGGMTTGGLGQSDTGNREAYGGIAREFYRTVMGHYRKPASWTRQRPEDYQNKGNRFDPNATDAMWTFEPSVALAILEGWEKRDGLDIRRGEFLVRSTRPHFIKTGLGKDEKGGVVRDKDRIVAIRTLSGNVYRGRMFIDATYEGDLLAEAGCSYVVGREGNAQYGETSDGIQVAAATQHQLLPGTDPYVVKGDPSSGLLPNVEPYDPNEKDGEADGRVQAYNLRLCLTDDPSNRVPFAKPANYRELNYELLFRQIEKGWDPRQRNQGDMPNRKTDTNNHGGFSTDLIGRSAPWAEASDAERRKIYDEHLDYTCGLFWTLANHPRVPADVRREYARWGTCRDEFQDASLPGWPSQLYVREARRLVGETVITEADCRGLRKSPRPVALGAYGMDSHHTRRHVGADGFVHNEGDIQDYSAIPGGIRKGPGTVRFPPYGIDYGALLPKRGECANLLVPVCVSASHIAFGSLRMEPVFFELGQVAATAAAQAIDADVAVQDVAYAPLRERLMADDMRFDWSALWYVDPFIGTEGLGSGYGGMQPYATVPFGSIHVVPMTRLNRIGQLSYNSLDDTLIGFILTRQPAIWMGDWGPVRIPIAPAKITKIESKPYLTRVTAGGKTWEMTATAHAAWIRGGSLALNDGCDRERMDEHLGVPLRNFGSWHHVEHDADGRGIRIGVSLISLADAKANLEREIGSRTFADVQDAAKAAWLTYFNRIQIDAEPDRMRIFYTALFHTLLYPRQIDENGRYYSAFDDKIHSGTMYNCFSLWDTYRAEHPWLTLIAPERVDGMMRSLLEMYREGGWLPKWPNPGYTGIMIGSPAEVVLAEAYAKGFRGFDLNLAYEAVKKNATVPQTGDATQTWEDRGLFGATPETRGGLSSYLTRGYVACDRTAESVSRTQDFGLDDCAAAVLAEATGHTGEAAMFRVRSKNYTNLWNAAAGQFLPRKADGTFVGGDWTVVGKTRGYRAKAYCEQKPETATWAIPYDTDGLAALLGGKEAAVKKLDDFFDRLFFAPDGRGNRSIHGNEPSHHCAYLYNRFGAPEKTQLRVRQILERCYSTNRKGFDGNEDCGQMSAWYILSSLGFYPLDPASGEYELGSPAVRSAELTFGAPYAPATLEIKVENYHPKNWRVKRVTLNGVEITTHRIRHADLVKGGILIFEMMEL